MGVLGGTGEHDRMTLIPTFYEKYFGMQIVRHRNGKEEQQERTSQRGRVLKRTVMVASLLTRRNRPPRQRRDQNNRKPEKIKELLHCFALSPPGKYRPSQYYTSQIPFLLSCVLLGTESLRLAAALDFVLVGSPISTCHISTRSGVCW